MALIDPHTKTAFASTDWDHYMQSRPPYPQSLTDIIYDYRQRHPTAGWERIVDIGAGVGIASTNFMPDFKIVHISDPSSLNHEKARKFLPSFAQHHNLDTKFEYTESTGEDAYKQIGQNQADMVICGTAAHFMDPDALVSSAGKILRPEGTLAIFHYWAPIFPEHSEQLNVAFAQAIGRALSSSVKSDDELSQNALDKVISRFFSGRGGLDFVPLPEDQFIDPQRVYINTGKGEILHKEQFLPNFSGAAAPAVPRVSQGERVLSYRSGEDPQAEGWDLKVNKKWLSNFLESLQPPGMKVTEHESPQGNGSWQDIFAKECHSGSIRMVWVANVILATKK